MKRYQISARDWDKELQSHFGDQYSIIHLSDSEVIELLMKFGRAEIIGENDVEQALKEIEDAKNSGNYSGHLHYLWDFCFKIRDNGSGAMRILHFHNNYD